MTDRTENIIALAEFVGLKSNGSFTDGAPAFLKNIGLRETPIRFNPYESADDCEAVVRKLNELGWHVLIHHDARNHPIQDTHVNLWRHGDIKKNGKFWYGDNWKQGVCELALKVLETDND